MLSAICFNFERSKIFWFGNGQNVTLPNNKMPSRAYLHQSPKTSGLISKG